MGAPATHGATYALYLIGKRLVNVWRGIHACERHLIYSTALGTCLKNLYR